MSIRFHKLALVLTCSVGIGGSVFAQTSTTTIENDESSVTTLDTPEARMAVEPLDWDVTRG